MLARNSERERGSNELSLGERDEDNKARAYRDMKKQLEGRGTLNEREIRTW